MSVTGFNLQRRRAKLNGEEKKEVQKEKTEEELRELAKNYKIKSYHNMKVETLKERLKDYGI